MFLTSKEFFLNFIKKFDLKSNKDKINSYYYKYVHTFKVVGYITLLSNSINLSKEDKEIAKVCAIFHDLGRFYQFEKTKQYNDYKSNYDHASISLNILKENNYFEKNNIDKSIEDIICFAIYNHNKLKINYGAERESMFAYLLRDADKISILEVLDYDILDNELISNEVYENFINMKLIDAKYVKNKIDSLCYHLAYIFDLKFDISKEIIKKSYMLDKYYKELNKHTTLEQFNKMKNIINNILNRKEEKNNMLDKKYDHLSVEKGKYELWKNNNYFEPKSSQKGVFSIVLPPPNITGKLHLGHAWDTTLADIIIRFKRMQGYETLWLPGMDHAAIATEAKVVQKLKKEGINKYELGREAFLKEAWKWKDEYSDNIRMQWAKLGLSLAYSKERFTLDEGLNKAVNYVFIKLYEEGLIYRGERIINWDPVAKTALSNEEVIYKDVKGAFYHIKYYLEDKSDYLRVATTRPETLFGDTAVAVNPNDERYKKFIGKNVILPIINKLIPVIADDHADPDFGTGVVKITPAHDPNDFEVGKRHNLERIKVINPDGTMNEFAGKYNGLDRFVCREELVKDLKGKDLLIEIEPITHSVGHSERTDAMIEPYLSKQWFVKMDSLAKRVLDTQKDKNEKVNFVPARFEKILTHWMEECHDWCISRQLWWGHRIPAWYKGDEIKVCVNSPGEGWIQDEDVLDTWFSSALWPFSTLGWPDITEDYKKFYPTNVLVTGYDIIFFWVCRMIFQGLHFTEKSPFKYCLIHGLIRDKQGRKMSKSLGNGVDPMDVIETYGCDSLRFFLASSSAPGQDLRYDEEKVKGVWNFINKLWNASRYVLMNLEDFKESDYTLDNLSKSDKYILSRMNKTIKLVTKHMDKFDFNIVASTLYDFIWTDFCDNYIEMSKFNQNNTTKTVLLTVLSNIIKMLHPFVPFVTEEIYSMLPIKDNVSIMISNYPTYDKKLTFDNEEKEILNMLEFITLFRNKLHDINCGKEFNVITENKDELLFNLLKVNDKIVEKSDYNDNVSVSMHDYFITIYFDNSSNKELELTNLNKELSVLKQSIERRKKLLSNENYVSKAPKDIVDKEKDMLNQENKRLSFIEEEIKRLKK